MDTSTQSILMAGSVAALTLGIFNGVAPSMADVTVGVPQDDVIHRNTQIASWMSAGIVGGVSVIMKDPTIFAIGASVVVGMNLWHRSANAFNPVYLTKTMAGKTMPDSVTMAPEKPASDPGLKPRTGAQYSGAF